MSRVQGIGPALTALVSGSMVLGGKICRCIPVAAKWAWDMAAQDPAATAERQEKADAAARKRAAAKLKARRSRRRKKASEDEETDPDADDQDDEDVDPETVTAPPVAPVVRGTGDTWGVLGIGAGVGVGAVYAGWKVVGEAAMVALAPHQPLILCAGGLAWMATAWMLSPPLPAATADEDQDDEFDPEDLEDDADGDDPEDLEDEQDVPAPARGLSPAQRLAKHVLMTMSDLEFTGRPAIHVKTLLSSAESAGLLSPGAMDKLAFMKWLEASGFPITKTVNIKGDRDQGVRVDRLTETLGMGPTEAVRRVYGADSPSPAPAPVQAPAPAPPEAPVRVLPEAPAAAVPGPRLALVKPLPQDPSHGSVQDAG